jgi:uncharacterized protein YjeT (DUF2065 family)
MRASVEDCATLSRQDCTVARASYTRGNAMDNSPSANARRMSGTAIVGTGVSIASTGVLFLLLGFAQYLRDVMSAATVLLLIGAVFVAVGVVVAMMGRSRKD